MSEAFAQESQPLKHRPWGITLESPGLYFMNLHEINSSQTLVTRANSVDYLFGFHAYAGRRENYFVSVGVAAHGREHQVLYNFSDPAANEYFNGVATSNTAVTKIDFMLYKPVWSKEKRTLFVMAGAVRSQFSMDGWIRNVQTVGGISRAEYIARQWGTSVGLMFDFCRSETGRHDISLAFKAGYTIPLMKARWYNPSGAIDPVERINMGGLNFSMVINYF